MEKLYFDLLDFEEEQYILIASEKGLQFIGLFDGKDPLIDKFVGKRDLTRDSKMLGKYTESLLKYFQGNMRKFQLDFDLQGTDFQKEVWRELGKVGYGQSVSYKELAERLDKPKSVRAVANAVGRNPLLIFVPCHRVIGTNGTLTGFRSGLDLKRKLLELEGIKYERNISSL
ncbi:MAG: methylated-DNA--[protein]-cysteine S-methyltransferase [Gemella sp.]|nr:methylated-DNA--[protein]-cysteine S-methyltransferase [Gemella sp.]